ncbi:Polycomb group RING finger protein 5, partial [Datura stramonium]|nr:Polycomb group RING finger protein 5 [Datura stramonium]
EGSIPDKIVKYRIRRRGNVVRFQDSSKFNNVVELNNQIKPEISQPEFQVDSSTQAYAAESSKKNKSRKSLDGMNDLLEPLNKLVTKGGVTLDNSMSRELVSKFTPVINLEDDDEDEDDDDDEEDEEYVPHPKIKEHKVSKENIVQKSVVVPAPAPASTPS